MNERQPDPALPVLEEACDECEGAGVYEERGRVLECPRCKGAGTRPTDAGRKILALVNHNFRAMLASTSRD